MSETEKLLKYYKSFYYRIWGSGHISSDAVYEISQDTATALGYSNDDIDSSQVDKELKKISES